MTPPGLTPSVGLVLLRTGWGERRKHCRVGREATLWTRRPARRLALGCPQARGAAAAHRLQARGADAAPGQPQSMSNSAPPRRALHDLSSEPGGKQVPARGTEIHQPQTFSEPS